MTGLGTEAVREQYSGVQKRIRRFSGKSRNAGFSKSIRSDFFNPDKPKIDSIILGDRRYWFNVVIHFQFEIDENRSIPMSEKDHGGPIEETPIDMGLAVEIFKTNSFFPAWCITNICITGILSEGGFAQAD